MLEEFSCTFHLIRHAECEKNTDVKHIHGRSPESPLTEKGKRQAAALGRRFRTQDIRFDHVYASPYLRTMTTANIMLNALSSTPEIIPTDALVEYSAGDWAGRRRDEIYTQEIIRQMTELGIDFCPPN